MKKKSDMASNMKINMINKIDNNYKDKKNEKNKIIILIILFLLMAFFIILLISVLTGSVQPFDEKMYKMVANMKNDNVTSVLKIITDLGGILGLSCITLVTVVILFLNKKRKYGILVTVNLLFSTLAYVILKNIVQRPRPPIEERLIAESGYSFPSGHATNNMAFYCLAIYLVCKNVKNRILKMIFCVLFALLAITISFSRIYLRVHYPSDVFAGICLGISCFLIITCFLKKAIVK